MSERHTIPAGEIGGYYIGRVIRAQVGDKTFVEDELAALMHQGGQTLIRFVHVQPDHEERLYAFGSASFALDFDDQIEVIEP